jgi:hypothetical protein
MRAGSDPSSKGEPKTIDFAIYLEPDKLMIEAIRTITSRYPSLGSPTSVNQTIHTPLQMRPIAVNIETKRTGEGWDAALLQVGVWVAAQFVKLEQLVTLQEKDVNDIPWLPVVIVQGHDWWFLAASRGEFGETVCALPLELFLYRLT